MVLLSQYVRLGLATGLVTMTSAGSVNHKSLPSEAIRNLVKAESGLDVRSEPELHQIRSTLSLARGLIEDRGTIGVPEEELRNILDRLRDLEKEVAGLLGGSPEGSAVTSFSGNGDSPDSAESSVSIPVQASADSAQASTISAPIVSVHPTAEPLQPVSQQMEPKVDSGGSHEKGVAVLVPGSTSSVPDAASGSTRPAPSPHINMVVSSLESDDTALSAQAKDGASSTGSHVAFPPTQSIELVSEVTKTVRGSTIVATVAGEEADHGPTEVFKEKVYVTTEDRKTTTVVKTMTSTETITLHRPATKASQHETGPISAEKLGQASPESSSTSAATRKSSTNPKPIPGEKFYKNETMKFFKNRTKPFLKQTRLPPKPTLPKTMTPKKTTQASSAQEVKVATNKAIKSNRPLAAPKMKIPLTAEDKVAQVNSTIKMAPMEDRVHSKASPFKNTTSLPTDITNDKMQVEARPHNKATASSTKGAEKIDLFGNATSTPVAGPERIVSDTTSSINRLTHLNSTGSLSSEADASANPTGTVNKMKGYAKALFPNSTMVTSIRSKIQGN